MVLGYIISGISYKWDMSKVGHVIRAPLNRLKYLERLRQTIETFMRIEDVNN